MHPFYNDHTAYGAALAMMIPVFIGFIFNSGVKKKIQLLAGLIVLFLLTAIVISYSRAAWLSLFIALIIFLIIYFRINFKVVIAVVDLFIGYIFLFPNNILFSLKKNNQDSSLNLAEHVQSISNIKSDASNLERLNRWNSALRMFQERPFTGWGPGTYQFLYAPYQLSKEKTIISTDLGDNGNAHSEYIGPLSESGILGLLTFLTIIFFVFKTSIKIYKNSANSQVRNLVLISLLGLVTYYIHGFLNNFLDTDKASALFWGFTAIIASLDVYHFHTEYSENNTDLKKTS
jgi:O-antigen ligase